MSSQVIKITVSDSLWSYLAQFVSIGSGIILLPLVLNKLTTGEIAVYYILFSFSSLVTLFDFGFSSQFGRNISYVFSGATKLKKEGVDYTDNRQVDYRLLKQLIVTARFIYRRLALYAVLILAVGGSGYLYKVTDGFSLTPQLVQIWILYIVSIWVKVRFLYYNALLTGKGQIKYMQQITVVYKVVNILLCSLLLWLNWGLLSVVVTELLSLAIQRFLAVRGFYSRKMKEKIGVWEVSKGEIRAMYSILWYNARKLGLTFFAGFLVSQLGLFFAGFYLSLEMVASYGLMSQLVMVISVLSSTLLTIHGPYFASCIVQHTYPELLKRFSILLLIFYLLFVLGILLLTTVVPPVLVYIRSQAHLPAASLVLVYSVIRLLESNHAHFASLLEAKNKVPYMKAALYSGFFTLVGLVVVLKYTDWGLWGIVLVPGIVQGGYQNWKWPKEMCKEYCISYAQLCALGVKRK